MKQYQKFVKPPSVSSSKRGKSANQTSKPDKAAKEQEKPPVKHGKTLVQFE